MKLVRLWLVLLLCLLLPIRGALAFAMACPGGSAPVALQAQEPAHAAASCAESHETAVPADMSGMDMEMSAIDKPEGPSAHAHGDGHADKCSTCQGCCASTALPSSLPAVPAAASTSATAFPALAAAPASFLSDGQERPPRSL